MKHWTETEGFLQNIELPSQTRTYKPISHQKFLRELQEKIESAGLTINNKKYLATPDGKVLTGEYGISSLQDEDCQLSIGFQNSYNKQIKAGIFGGILILKCANGLYGYTEQGSYKKKHTGNIQEEIEENITRVINFSQQTFEELKEQKNKMKEIEISKKTIAALVGDMYLNEDIINATQLGIVKGEISFSEHFKEKTVYSLYNWITEAMKSTHPTFYIKNHVKLHAYISNKFDINISTQRDLYGKLEEV